MSCARGCASCLPHCFYATLAPTTGLRLRDLSRGRPGAEDGSEPQLWGVAVDASVLEALPLADEAAHDAADQVDG